MYKMLWLKHVSKVRIRPDQCGTFRASADTDIKQQENSDIRYINQYFIYM